MNRRSYLILSIGAVLLLATHVALSHWVKGSLPHFPESSGYFSSSFASERSSGLAPVQVWWERPLEQKGYRRAKKSARLLLVNGQVFVADDLLPRDKITAYLDARVRSGEIDYVVVFPVRNTKWGDIFPVLDECRKSRVRIVLLNQFES